MIGVILFLLSSSPSHDRRTRHSGVGRVGPFPSSPDHRPRTPVSFFSRRVHRNIGYPAASPLVLRASRGSRTPLFSRASRRCSFCRLSFFPPPHFSTTGPPPLSLVVKRDHVVPPPPRCSLVRQTEVGSPLIDDQRGSFRSIRRWQRTGSIGQELVALPLAFSTVRRNLPEKVILAGLFPLLPSVEAGPSCQGQGLRPPTAPPMRKPISVFFSSQLKGLPPSFNFRSNFAMHLPLWCRTPFPPSSLSLRSNFLSETPSSRLCFSPLEKWVCMTWTACPFPFLFRGVSSFSL